MSKLVRATFVLAVLAASAQGLAAQTTNPPQTTEPLAIGAMAPEFSLAAATRFGVLDQPVKLSDFKGKTVVVAFFPRARTRGCTIQMRAYRDQYPELFKDGQNVVLIGMSVDPVEELASWAKDEQFPFLFASDVDGKVAEAFGARRPTGNTNRNLFVIDPDGKVSYRALPFREVDPVAYEELTTEIGKVWAEPEVTGN
jgi:thioredoxin-dependent peroxiredoxin